ncbi:hypothetical protein [Mediterraneibacter gnavus]|uniref:SPOR domain-containing protein n=1 Tax=Mediterraneibacter gnavus (strain ATCC 29149 / DSM 114966 / JCM 6515 / VPI C7-9) TaxID=411470 RepID=A7B6M0_MEDG7|nr:hypothetical protein [Mediterraneibacter gnavus]EDN76411.1 hypothetical protein RUMGNA_03233 [Mediterraneibacter gnavus ATCC 29149]UZT21479.1 hypothetical protein ORL52_18070 [Mediterraneibacter gnavus]UZT24971.1 hypothetical protein ORL61_17980 [Mediterraneibacter gnavus]
MKANVIINAQNEQEAERHIEQLQKNGYKRVANCYWTEIFKKEDGWTVQVNRDF